MSRHTLSVETRIRPEVLERILRVTRHRGFSIQSLDMRPSRDHRQMQITFEVHGKRPIGQLCTQLDKLADVAQVQAVLYENPKRLSSDTGRR